MQINTNTNKIDFLVALAQTSPALPKTSLALPDFTFFELMHPLHGRRKPRGGSIGRRLQCQR